MLNSVLLEACQTLKDAGFQVVIKDSTIEVSLLDHQVSSMEVSKVFWDTEFEDLMSFNPSRSGVVISF